MSTAPTAAQSHQGKPHQPTHSLKVPSEEELMDEMDLDTFPVLTLNRYPSVMPSKSKLQELAA